MPSFVEIAKIVKAHGIAGELCLEYFADSPALLKKTLFLGYTESSTQRTQIETLRLHKDRFLVRFPFIKDRTAAEKLRGMFLFIEDSDLPRDDSSVFYFHELLNMKVYNNSSYVGIVSNVQSFPGQEIWYIKGINNEEILFPAVDEFILSVSKEEQKIIISPPPGLLELYK